jgi:hypothetical protein
VSPYPKIYKIIEFNRDLTLIKKFDVKAGMRYAHLLKFETPRQAGLTILIDAYCLPTDKELP